MDMENYVRQLLEEKDLLDAMRSAHSIRLLEEEIERVRSGKEPSTMSPIRKARFEEEVIKLAEKVFLPVTDFPRYNFVGKILGPKGSTLKGIQASTQSKISILGRGSTRDSKREEELSQSDDPQYAHFKEPLHILIQTEAPKSEAHARLAAALKEIKACMEAEMDEMRQGQVVGGHGRESQVRSRGSVAPIIRFGIPPPGAIILNDQPLNIDNRYSRVGREERPVTRPSSIPRNASPRRDPFDYDKYGSPHSAAYERYPEAKESLHYDDRYDDNDSYRRVEKRPAMTSDYVTKKYREDSYNDLSHETGSYRSAAY